MSARDEDEGSGGEESLNGSRMQGGVKARSITSASVGESEDLDNEDGNHNGSGSAADENGQYILPKKVKKNKDLDNVRQLLASISFQSDSSNDFDRAKIRVKRSSYNMDKVPLIQSNTTSVAYQLGSFQESFGSADNVGYNQTDSTEALNSLLHRVEALDSMVEQGRDFVHMLYTYRAVSRAVPDVDISMNDDGSGNVAERLRRIVDVLRPEITKLQDFQAYVIQATEIFRTCLVDSSVGVDASFSSSSLLAGARSDVLYQALVRLLDILMQLDSLKEVKTASLLADFTKYKLALIEATRAHYGDIANGSNAEETSLLELFLDNPDPRRKQYYVFQYLCDEVLRYSGLAVSKTVETLIEIMMNVTLCLRNKYFVTPEDKFTYLRVLPFLVILIDNISEDDQQIHTAKETEGNTKLKWVIQMGPKIFKAPAAFLDPIQYFFLQYPVVPFVNDLTLNLVSILERSPRFKMKKSGVSWGAKPDSRVVGNYDIGANWEQIRNDFTAYSTLFVRFINTNPHADNKDISSAKRAFDFIQQGSTYVSEWSCVLRQVLAWKYTHPASLSRLQTMGVIPRNVTQASDLITDYEQAVRFNMTPEIWSMFADVISMIKSLVSLLQQAESTLAPLLRLHCHQSIQTLVQAELLPLTHRVDKRKAVDMLPILLQIRAIAADWMDGEEPLENYKQHKRKLGVVGSEYPVRVVSSSNTQLRILRCYVQCIYNESSSTKMRYGIMGRKTDLEPSDITSLEMFYRSSYFFPSVLQYSAILTEISNLSYLWTREIFLERAGVIQFPIEMSIPWILTEHVSTTKGVKRDSVPLIEKLFYVLDIYNDATQSALYEHGRQHLYNEAEAEANLVLDQVVYLFSEDVYTYYKNSSAITAMEKSFRSKLEELKRSPYLSWNKRRLDVPLAQRNVQLLGRSVDFNFLVARHLNDKIRVDVDCALRRFESGSVCGIPELQLALEIIRSTHEKLSTFLDLDSFSEMLTEIDETFAPSSVLLRRGRMASHVVYSVMCDVFPNFSYNFYTQRFVPSPIPLQPCSYSRAPKRAAIDHMFGPVCAKAYERSGLLTRGFFGRVHLEAMLQVFGYIELPRLVDECLQIIADKLQDLTAYVTALGAHIPACHLPHSCGKNPEHAYNYFHTRLEHILEFDDLKPEVFQTFRYIGNAIAFFKNLSAVLEIYDQFEFLAVAPLLGLVPDASANKAESYAARSPLVKSLRNFARSDNPNSSTDRYNNDTAKGKIKQNYSSAIDAYLLQQLPGMAHRSINVLAPSLGSHNLFEAFLGKFHALFLKLGLLEAWDLQYTQSEQEGLGKFYVPAPGGFQRLWTTLNFLFCEQDLESGTRTRGSGEPYCAHEDEFGHGFLFAGSFFTHIMSHRDSYGLLDYGEAVFRVHLERMAATQLSDMQRVVGERTEKGVLIEEEDDEDDKMAMSVPVSLFIDNVALGRQLFQEMSAYYKALGERAKNSFHHNGNSGGASADDVHGGARHTIQLFHPPREHTQ